MDKLRLFKTIETLASSHYARIEDSPVNKTVNITFVIRATGEFVCYWQFDRKYFNKELKILFHKKNSATGERREINE